MCGIAGAVFWNDPPSGVDPVDVVRGMTDSLAHRGPDGEGVVVCQPASAPLRSSGPLAVFGHRRLAVIDPTPAGAQPMASDRVPVCLTFNGEIFNFREIRRTLEGLGRRFHSDSDTEVLLQGYEQWGGDVVERLRGMFAFAIWDGRSRSLVIARDRIGIKPLYVHRTAECVLFASEVRALLASGLVDRRLDLAAVDAYLAYQTVPTPRTLIRGVEMLSPATIAVATADGPWQTTSYWDLFDSADADAQRVTDVRDAERRVGELLAESTALHLVSDVPVGIFLSGGIDSGALVALVGATGARPQTFTIAFPGTSFDEARHARAVADAHGASHHEITLTERDLLDQLPGTLAAVDHPSGDGINTDVVSRAVSATGMKVALSGLGGDEFFGGYPSFQRFEKTAALARAWRHSPPAIRRAAAAAVRTIGRASIATSKAAALIETDGSVPQAFPVMRQMFSPGQRRELLTAAVIERASRVGDAYVALLERAAGGGARELMAFVSYAEARTYMHDVLLRDTDQMSMRHGLEVRVPLLDHRLVEYLMGLPDAVKRASGRPKGLLVDSLGSRVSAGAMSRPKQGFTLPFDLWMRGALRPCCAEHLEALGRSSPAVFERAGLDALWQRFLGGDPGLTWSRPWTLVALSAWITQNRINA